MYLKAVFTFLFVFLFAQSGNSQTLQDELKKDPAYNHEGYLAPLSQVFGASLSSGIYFNAESYSFPHFDFGISYTSTSIPSDKYTQRDSENSPTVFGKTLNDSTKLSGLDISNFKLPVFHFSMGIGDNINFILRYTDWNINKIGKVKLIGGGIKYELENLLSITPIPMDVAILAIYQKYQVDDFLEGAVFSMNIVGSKDFGIIPLSLYGGVGYLNNITNVENPDSEDEESYSIDGLEEVKGQIGLNYSILFINLNVEYNFGKYKSFNGGIRIVF